MAEAKQLNLDEIIKQINGDETLLQTLNKKFEENKLEVMRKSIKLGSIVEIEVSIKGKKKSVVRGLVYSMSLGVNTQIKVSGIDKVKTKKYDKIINIIQHETTEKEREIFLKK